LRHLHLLLWLLGTMLTVVDSARDWETPVIAWMNAESCERAVGRGECQKQNQCLQQQAGTALLHAEE
jgi:hypothetical protein